MALPPIPADLDLRRLPYTPIVRGKLFNSWFHTHASPVEWRAGMTLWLKSWDQLPGGSLPDDDVELAFLADFGRDIKAWQKVRRVALHNWVRFDDGRLYHPTVTEVVLDALVKRQSYQERGAKGGRAKAENRSSATSSATNSFYSIQEEDEGKKEDQVSKKGTITRLVPRGTDSNTALHGDEQYPFTDVAHGGAE